MPKTKKPEKKEEEKAEEIEFEEFNPDSDQIRVPVEEEPQRIEEVLGIPLDKGRAPVGEELEIREERTQTEQASYSPEQSEEGPSYGPSTEYGSTNYNNDQYQPTQEPGAIPGELERLIPTAGASKDEIGKQQGNVKGYISERTDIDRELLDREHWREGRKKKRRV